jgi:hypothetical protein
MLRNLCLVAAILFVGAARAWSTTDIRVSSNSLGNINCISAPDSWQLVDFHVVVFSDVPLKTVSFRLAIPPILVWIDDAPDFAEAAGTSPLLVTIPLGGCASAPIHVMTVRCFVGAWETGDCQFIVVQNAAALDCDGQPVMVPESYSRVVPGPCEISGPADPSPPDHGDGVALNTTLNWTAQGAHTCALGEIVYYSLYFGTDPNPPFLAGTQQTAFPGMTPPRPLLPGTQYYWRVLATQYDYNSSLGPVWTFRTAGPVAIRQTTWGAIKALYR